MEITADEAMGLTIAEMTTDHYLPAKRKRGRRPNTLYGYESSLNLHALPRFGDLTLSELTRDAVQDWVDELAGTDAGPGGAEKAYKCLRQVIRWAIDHWGLYLADPTRGIELPRKPVYKPETLTERRLKRLIRGMVGCAYEATAIIQCSLGLRPSENYSLRWERIDWRTGHVPIERSLGEIPGLVYEDGTKTPKSERGCYLPPWALDRLHAIWVGLGRPRGRIIGDAKQGAPHAQAVGGAAQAALGRHEEPAAHLGHHRSQDQPHRGGVGHDGPQQHTDHVPLLLQLDPGCHAARAAQGGPLDTRQDVR